MYNFRPDAAPEPITQNYRLPQVSIDGQLRKVIAVIEMRGGNHAKDIREYEITSCKRLTNCQGLIRHSGCIWTDPTRWKSPRWIRNRA
jgi:hypothetical protein